MRQIGLANRSHVLGKALELISLRELPNMHDVPAIALSGYATAKDTKMALAAGFNAHVSKPIEPAELLKTTTRLLKKNRNP